MSVLKQAWEEIKEYYRTMCMPAFSEEEKARNIRVRFTIEYTKYCKLAASEGYLSDVQMTAYQYKELLEEGFVWSKNRFNVDCWYNRSSDKTMYLKDLVNV